MKEIKVVGRYRGFLLNLFKNKFTSVHFEYDIQKNFEVPHNYKRLLLKIFNMRMFDFMGLFTSYNIDSDKELDCDFFSYNRFVKNVKTNYYVYLENPTALVNYSPTKMKSLIGKMRTDSFFRNQSLKKVVCMSNACYSSFDKYYDSKFMKKVDFIYPFYNDLEQELQNRALRINNDYLNILFIGATFIGKGGLEFCEMIRVLNANRNSSSFYKFTIVTKIDNIPNEYNEFLKNQKNVELKDFNLKSHDLKSIYLDADLFILPTRYESFGMVFLEAMKNGCALVGPRIYAIEELIEDGRNGFLYSPRLRPWNNDYLPEKKVIREIEKINRTTWFDTELVEFLVSKVIFLNKNRGLMRDMKSESLTLSKGNQFGESVIAKKWEKLLEE